MMLRADILARELFGASAAHGHFCAQAWISDDAAPLRFAFTGRAWQLSL